MKHKSIQTVGVFILGAAAFFAESTFLAEPRVASP